MPCTLLNYCFCSWLFCDSWSIITSGLKWQVPEIRWSRTPVNNTVQTIYLLARHWAGKVGSNPFVGTASWKPIMEHAHRFLSVKAFKRFYFPALFTHEPNATISIARVRSKRFYHRILDLAPCKYIFGTIFETCFVPEDSHLWYHKASQHFSFLRKLFSSLRF